MRLLPVLATAAVCTTCCVAFGLLCGWAWRRDSRRMATTVEVRPAQTSDTTRLPRVLTQRQKTIQVRMFADARTARYGRVDEFQWETEFRNRATS